jgi:hypothetical protein
MVDLGDYILVAPRWTNIFMTRLVRWMIPYKDIGLFLWKGGLHKAENYCRIKPKFHCAVLTN